MSVRLRKDEATVIEVVDQRGAEGEWVRVRYVEPIETEPFNEWFPLDAMLKNGWEMVAA